MDVGVYPYPHGDPLLIDKIVNEFLSQGKFDKLRKECMSDADTKPAYQNLQQRVETTVTQFLKKQVWRPDLNKNQLRDSLRKHILESGFFDAGINRIVDQVVNPNVLATVFLPEVEEVVYNYLSIPRPADKTQKRAPASFNEKIRPPGGENDDKLLQENEKYERGTIRDKPESTGGYQMDHTEENIKPKEGIGKNSWKDKDAEPSLENIKIEPGIDEKAKVHKNQPIKTDDKIKIETEDIKIEENIQSEIQGSFEKMELPSDDSQESLSRMGVEGLQINEPEGFPPPDSDDSIPLEINEKSMSESRDSEDSIMNQMSPISQGRLTPDILEEEKVEEKVEKEEKKPLTFIGRIPKIKREDSSSSKAKEETPKKEKLDVKNVYSSDESDSSKSYGKSDSDDRKSRENKKNERKSQKDDKRHDRDDSERRKKHDDRHKSSKDSSRDRKSRDDKSKDRNSKDRRKDSRESREDKKSSSSSSSSAREKSSSRHKSSHQSRSRDTKSKENSHDKKRKEEEKKKSKSTDDHGKERNKKDDRRSTDRDSNERERDKASGSRSQGESRKREKEQKTEETREEKTQKEDAQVENDVEVAPESEVIIEMEEDWMPDNEIVLVGEEWVCSEEMIKESEVRVNGETDVVVRADFFEEPAEATDNLNVLDFNELFQNGAVTKLEFPKLTDDFYLKFNSTGFRYFEEWEKSKLDCEEEFKEFVDEAENNLGLISEDESDVEFGNNLFSFEEENRRTITNLLRGVGNFKKSVMFDPATSRFYKWTNKKFYQKFRKKSEKRGRRNTEKNESDESIKENIDSVGKLGLPVDFDCHREKNKENQEREKALHLKLLNRYRRKAMRHGKQKRRHKKGKNSLESGGIKEKNENRNASGVLIKNLGNFEPDNGFLFKSEVMGVSEANCFLGSGFPDRISGLIPINEKISSKFESECTFTLVQSENSTDGCGSYSVAGSEALANTETEGTTDLQTSETCDFKSKNEFGQEGKVKNRVNGLNSSKSELLMVGKNGLETKVTHTATTLGESPKSCGNSPDSEKRKKGVQLDSIKQTTKSQSPDSKEETISENEISEKTSLSFGPDDGDVNANKNYVTSKENKNKRMQKLDPAIEGAIPRKQSRRNYSQKYDSQDLYKPRPVLNTSRTRGRGRGLEPEIIGVCQKPGY